MMTHYAERHVALREESVSFIGALQMASSGAKLFHR